MDLVFIILSDLNSNLNDLIEILFIRVFLADFMMCLNISLISNKFTTKFLFYSIAFCIFIF